LFSELPYLERPAAARRAGFRWVESAWPAAAERAGVPRAAADAGVRVALLNCSAGQVDRGERGFINCPSRREEAERAFAAALTLAGQLGAPVVNVLVGRALEGVSAVRQRAAVVSALRAFAAEAAVRGLRIVIEPLNATENPGYLAPAPKDALTLIEAVGSDSVGLLFDVYHVARAGADPLAAIAEAGGRIGHVQISDFPGRGQPGSGALDLRGILDALAAGGYSGAIGLEYQPPAAGTAASLAFLGEGGWPASL
ncbi:MAG TPA: TIM barrel protein, partial [Solirubrobacteraceae bacterium]|nr:TIM barrel protein [Solirubrobacteraceae bacterium]